MQTQQTSKFQAIGKFRELWTTKQRYTLLVGGAGSGKSVAATQWVIMQALAGERVFCLRKVGSTLKRSVYLALQDIMYDMGVRSKFSMNGSDLSFTVIGAKGSITCSGVDDPEKMKSLRDPSVFFLEEATEFNLADFEEIDRRMRVLHGLNRIILCCNPISTRSWVYKTFIEDTSYSEATTVMHSTFADNPFLPDSYKKSLERLRGLARDVYLYGKWGRMTEGLIYPDYSLVNVMPEGRYFYGLDFGFVDPHAFVQCLIVGENLYVRELLYMTHVTTNELIGHLKRLGITSSDTVYADPSGANDIAILRAAGFDGIRKAVSGPGSIMSGIRLVNSQNIIVVRGSTNMLKEIESFSFRKNREGEYIENPEDGFDHLMDAMRIAVLSKLRKPIPSGSDMSDDYSYL